MVANSIPCVVSIGREKAVAMAEAKWWEGKSAREIAGVQLFIDECCCPFPIFHRAIGESLGRCVWNAELGSEEGYRRLISEFLGESEPPTLADIANLMPDSIKAVFV